MKACGTCAGLGIALAAMHLVPGSRVCAVLGWAVAAILVCALTSDRSTYKQIFAAGFLGSVCSMHWVWPTIQSLSGFSPLLVSVLFLIFAAAQSLTLPLSLAIYRRLPIALDALSLRTGLAYVSIEWLPLQLFPWRLGHSQWAFKPFAQLAELGGALLISLAMIWSCDALLRGCRTRNRNYLATLMLVLLATLLFGVLRIERFSNSDGARLTAALAQPGVRAVGEDSTNEIQFRRLKTLTEGLEVPVDLVIWPETTSPFTVHESVHSIQNDRRLPVLGNRASLLFGTKSSRRPDRIFNSAMMIHADGRVPLPYHKRLPIPFGEYVPLADYVPFLGLINPTAETTSRGIEAKLFEVSYAGATQTTQVSPLICYEEVFPSFGIESANLGAEILVGLSDDAWSVTSGRLPLQQHFILSAFRTIETRRSMLRATSTGITGALNPAGQVVSSLAPFEEGVLIASVSVERYKTFYAAMHGDLPWGVLGVLVFLSAVIPRSIWKRSQRSYATRTLIPDSRMRPAP